MAHGDYSLDWAHTKLENAVKKYEQLHPTKAQFVRMGRTSGWFKPAVLVLKGKRHVYRAYTQPLSGVRRELYETAVAGEFPVARDYGVTELSVSHADLVMFQASMKWNLKREVKMANAEASVFDLAKKTIRETENDFTTQTNAALFQPSTCQMAVVDTPYMHTSSTTGAWTTWGDGAMGGAGHEPIYIKIKNGASAQFMPNMIIDIYRSGVQQHRAIVHDVIYGENGPWAGGSRTAGAGPGIICEPCAEDGSVSSGTGYNFIWYSTMATSGDNSAEPTDGDVIVRSGEYATGDSAKNFHGLADWFDTTVDCWRDVDGTAIERDTTGYHWMNPEVFIPDGASAGSEVEFEIEEHLAEMEDVLPNFLDFSRNDRVKLNQDLP
ncbi:MAG TPA: hypothetical protein VNA25_03685, partial [Phycisphaerae bacterium]|nr:hypothetical protein [Phycisphaerae bacterium]